MDFSSYKSSEREGSALTTWNKSKFYMKFYMKVWISN